MVAAMAHPNHPANRDPAFAPADAYGIVVPHLPPGYLTTPPPPSGVMLHVTATSDRVTTQWAMGRDDAINLARILQNTRGVKVLSSAYTDRRL